MAHHTVAQLLDGRVVPGDGGYRGIATITTSRRDTTRRINRDDHHRPRRPIGARIEHVIAQLKD